MWSLILVGNFYNEDNKSSHENSSQKLIQGKIILSGKFKSKRKERPMLLNIKFFGFLPAYKISRDEWRVVFKIFM